MQLNKMAKILHLKYLIDHIYIGKLNATPDTDKILQIKNAHSIKNTFSYY